MAQNSSAEQNEGISDYNESIVIDEENNTEEGETDTEPALPFTTRIVDYIKYVIVAFYNINYSMCIMIGLLFAILSTLFSNTYLTIKYENKQIEDKLCLGSLLLILAVLMASYIAMTLLTRLIASYVQRKKKRFSHTIYTIIAVSDNLSLMVIGFITIVISYYYDNNFQFSNSFNFNMLSHDLIGLVILGNFILALMTSLVKLVSFNFNRDTFMERMLLVLRVDYFLKLLKSIKNHRDKVKCKPADLWEYAFPWISDNANLPDYRTEEYVKKKTLYFSSNVNQITPDLRDWIYKEFKKQPESILFGTNNLDLQNLDLKFKKKNKLVNKNIEAVKDIEKYFATRKHFDKFCRVMNFTEETLLKPNYLTNMFKRNMMEKRYIQASLSQINGCLHRIQISCYVVICSLLIIYTALIGYGDTPILFTVISAFFGTGFAFQPSVKDAIDSVLFLLCIHPYDVGDRIFIEIDDKIENLVVHELNVFSTVFTKFDGSLSIVSNAILKTKQITNVRRSGFMAETYRICINSDIETEKLAMLRKSINEYVNQKLDDFTGAIFLNVETVQDPNKMYIKVYVQYKRNWHDYNTYLRLKHKLLYFISQKLNEIGFIYKMPTQPVKIVA